MQEQLNRSTGAKAGTAYWSGTWLRFRKNRLARYSLYVLYVLGFIALFANLLANDKPLYCRYDGRTYYPAVYDYAVELGLAEFEAEFVQRGWYGRDYQAVLWPPIPYSAENLDARNMRALSPFATQRVESWRFRHWLGTDSGGRDIAAGMINGTRIALIVGFLSMAIAVVIGIVLGTLAGYYGDSGLRSSYLRLLLQLLAILLAVFYLSNTRYSAVQGGEFSSVLSITVMVLLLFLWLLQLLLPSLERRLPQSWIFPVPADLLVMRLIEIMNSIPALLLLIAIAATVRERSVWTLILIIGLINWTGIARFVRGELLKIRAQPYIEAARALGMSEYRIVIRHALPNALQPVLITISFGIAAAILLEAFLSFLNIGLTSETVTWGSILRLVTNDPSAWWLAVFPGMAIFITVTALNLIGDALSNAINPRSDAAATEDMY